MIGCFDLLQTQRERHAVKMEAAIFGEECHTTTQNGCIGDYSTVHGLIFGRAKIWGAYFREGLFLEGLIIGILWFILK